MILVCAHRELLSGDVWMWGRTNGGIVLGKPGNNSKSKSARRSSLSRIYLSKRCGPGLTHPRRSRNNATEINPRNAVQRRCSFTLVMRNSKRQDECKSRSVQPRVAETGSLSVPNLTPKAFVRNIATIVFLLGSES